MVKKVIMNLDSSKASGPDCIPVLVLKNCELELSYILAKLFNNCRKKSCFPDCWKVSLVVPVFKNVGERSTDKNYRPVSLLSVVSKVFLLFSVIGGFGLFWMGNLHRNIQLMLVFLKGLFLVLHFSYYALMTFLMVLSVILLSMLMILLPTLNAIRHLICGNN